MTHRLTCAHCGAMIDMDCDDITQLLEQWRAWLGAHGCGCHPNDAERVMPV